MRVRTASLLLLGGLLLASCSGEDQEEMEASTVPCRASHGAHDQGIVTARRDAHGALLGWQCVFSPHHLCTSGMDGEWTECTFPPDFMPWPKSLSASELRRLAATNAASSAPGDY